MSTDLHAIEGCAQTMQAVLDDVVEMQRTHHGHWQSVRY